jgi:hypothetical protein
MHPSVAFNMSAWGKSPWTVIAVVLMAYMVYLIFKRF